MTKQAVFTMGIPGAGKSTVANDLYPDHHYIDPDLHKVAHPDYDPKNPGALHVWSKAKTKVELAAAMLANDDIVVDGTGTNFAPLLKKMRDARNAGFEIVLLYVSVPLEIALQRNRDRARTVDETIVRDKADGIEIAFEVCAKEADVVVQVNTA